MQEQTIVDVAVVGAGLAGLVCAQQLQRAGLRVVVVEKSRGLGGRLATRRLEGTCADHGVRYLEVQGPLTEQLIQTLLAQNVIQLWCETLSIAGEPTTGEPIIDSTGQQPALKSLAKFCYTSATGLTAVAKWLAKGLEIWTAERVESLKLQGEQNPVWQISLTPGEHPDLLARNLLARSVVLAIPAPQALTLLEPLANLQLNQAANGTNFASLIQAIRSIELNPCITAIATYPQPGPQLEGVEPAILVASPDLAWVSQEQTKGRANLPVLVVQSTAEFARQHLEAPDLKPMGQLLLQQVAKMLSPQVKGPVEKDINVEEPTDLQVHRWRYGLVQQPLLSSDSVLSTNTPAPLVCSGDWCSGNQIENALASGLTAGQRMAYLLNIQPTEPDRMFAGELVVQFTALLHQLSCAS